MGLAAARSAIRSAANFVTRVPANEGIKPGLPSLCAAPPVLLFYHVFLPHSPILPFRDRHAGPSTVPDVCLVTALTTQSVCHTAVCNSKH
jgi:hypothetical protein